MLFSIIKETAMFFTAGNVVSAFGELFCLLKNYEMLDKRFSHIRCDHCVIP